MLANTAHAITKCCTDFNWGQISGNFATNFIFGCTIQPFLSKMLLIWVSQKGHRGYAEENPTSDNFKPHKINIDFLCRNTFWP